MLGPELLQRRVSAVRKAWIGEYWVWRAWWDLHGMILGVLQTFFKDVKLHNFTKFRASSRFEVVDSSWLLKTCSRPLWEVDSSILQARDQNRHFVEQVIEAPGVGPAGEPVGGEHLLEHGTFADWVVQEGGQFFMTWEEHPLYVREAHLAYMGHPGIWIFTQLPSFILFHYFNFPSWLNPLKS